MALDARRRPMIGTSLLVSAAMMVATAVACWQEWIPVASPAFVAAVLCVVAVIDVMIALKFLGEPGS